MPRLASDHDLLPKLRELAPRIAARVGPADPVTGCQEWLGAFTRNGYGTYTLTGEGGRWRSVRAHRAVFMLHFGRAIAEGMTLHHTCRNTRCVSPHHLVELSQADNNAADATGGASIRRRTTKAGVDRWAVLYREAGKQRSRTFPTREQAEVFATARLDQAA